MDHNFAARVVGDRGRVEFVHGVQGISNHRRQTGSDEGKAIGSVLVEGSPRKLEAGRLTDIGWDANLRARG